VRVSRIGTVFSACPSQQVLQIIDSIPPLSRSVSFFIIVHWLFQGPRQREGISDPASCSVCDTLTHSLGSAALPVSPCMRTPTLPEMPIEHAQTMGTEHAGVAAPRTSQWQRQILHGRHSSAYPASMPRCRSMAAWQRREHDRPEGWRDGGGRSICGYRNVLDVIRAESSPQ